MSSEKPEMDFNSQLKSVPIRNAKVRAVSAKADSAVFEVDLKYNRLLYPFAMLLGMRKSRKYELYGLSLELYRTLDGTRSTENLIDELAERFKLTFFESRALVTSYLSMLMRRGLIVIVGRNSSAPPADSSSL